MRALFQWATLPVCAAAAASVLGPACLAQSPRLPGSSRADALLQRDAMFYVAISVGVTHKDCRQFKVVDTALDGPDPSVGPRRPWRELWTVAGCGERWRVPVRFTPDATGTNISVPIGHSG